MIQLLDCCHGSCKPDLSGLPVSPRRPIEINGYDVTTIWPTSPEKWMRYCLHRWSAEGGVPGCYFLVDHEWNTDWPESEKSCLIGSTRTCIPDGVVAGYRNVANHHGGTTEDLAKVSAENDKRKPWLKYHDAICPDLYAHFALSKDQKMPAYRETLREAKRVAEGRRVLPYIAMAHAQGGLLMLEDAVAQFQAMKDEGITLACLFGWTDTKEAHERDSAGVATLIQGLGIVEGS